MTTVQNCPVKFGGQEQVKLPLVLVQDEAGLQRFSSHSFTSVSQVSPVNPSGHMQVKESVSMNSRHIPPLTQGRS